MYISIVKNLRKKAKKKKIAKIQKCEKQNLLWVADEEAVEADDIC